MYSEEFRYYTIQFLFSKSAEPARDSSRRRALVPHFGDLDLDEVEHRFRNHRILGLLDRR